MKIVFIAFLVSFFPLRDAAYSHALENNLRTLLFTTNSYNKQSRPQNQVTVNASFNMLTLNSLNIRDQAMTIAGYFTLQWSDARLDWSANPTYSTDIPVIYSTQDYVWIPSLSVTNLVSDIAVISDDTVIIRITKSGTLSWTPGAVYNTQCSTDVTYYPFDTQTCSVTLTTWGYTNIEINLQAVEVDTSYYEANGEWEYTGNSLDSSTRTSGSLSDSMPQVSYVLTFIRRPTYQVMNTIIPMILLGFLSCYVFQLPPDSGEKIGFSLTTLLAFAVYLTMVSADMPTTSINTSVLSLYLIIVLAMGIIAVLMTIFVLRCHHSPEDKPIPNYLGKICKLAKGMFGIGCCCKRNTVLDLEKDKMDKKGKIKDPVEAFEPELSWPEVTLILDKLFFKVYLSLMVTSTTVVLLILVIHYYVQ